MNALKFPDMAALAKKATQRTSGEPPEMAGIVGRLVYAMERAGYDPKTKKSQLEAEARLSNGVIGRALKGVGLHGMSATVLIRIANTLGVRVSWLLVGEEPVGFPRVSRPPDPLRIEE